MSTIADVAHEAGVSISTVSYVMSGKRTISQETRERVEQAIERLEFRPHASARSLASRSTNVIGLQAPLRSGVDVHVVMEIVAGVVRAAREQAYDVLLLASDDASGLDRASKASMVDALLVMDIESHDTRLSTLAGLTAPTVLIGLPDGAGELHCVDFDFEAAGALAVKLLSERGHRRIAMIGAPSEVMDRHTSYADRVSRGFLQACEANGVVGSFHACPSTVAGARVVDEVLAADPAISAFFVHNEGALPHVAARLATTGTPEQSPDIVALSPAAIAQAVPGLTHIIDLPAEQIGAVAARTLLGLLAGGSPDRVQLLAPQAQAPVIH